MRIRVLGAFGGLCPGCLLTSFQINDDIIMDAGSMAESLPLADQGRVRHVLLTHSHLDHTCTLPFFVDNIFGMHNDPVTVYGISETLKSIRDNLFNNDIWPDFSVLPNCHNAIMRFSELTEETPTPIGGLTVTAVRVNHTVPTVGYVFQSPQATVVFSGDTSATERLWEVAATVVNLKAVFVEASFPNNKQDIADLSGHLTPQTLALELKKLRRDVPVYIYHIKPRFFDEVAAELKQIKWPRLEIVEQGRTYAFD